jgi:hypothetical protein
MPREPRPPLRFGIGELAGSLGDFGTILPLSLALAATGALGIGPVLLFLGIWFIVTGYYYRYPIPVEPMKAIAVIAVSAGMSCGEIAAAGIILGAIFLLLGFTNVLEIIERYIPLPVVRGIQLGLALILLKTAAGYLIPDRYISYRVQSSLSQDFLWHCTSVSRIPHRLRSSSVRSLPVFWHRAFLRLQRCPSL